MITRVTTQIVIAVV